MRAARWRRDVVLNESAIHPAHPPLQKIHIQVDSGPLAARQVFDLLKRDLADTLLEVEELGAIELVLAEAVNNIVEHAYSNGRRKGTIHLHCQLRRDGLHFEITDNGLPMPGGCTPLGRAVNVNVDPMNVPEGGYGWFLIQDLAKDVTYRRRGRVNHLSLRMAVAIDGGQS
tara:strand:+ start:33123 stop:33635 length:513 start_codon:yes stop_codon:yes gene_type:complete